MKFAVFVLTRVVLLVPVLVGIASLTFLVSRVLPADPAAVIAGPTADEATIERIRSQLGLDRSIPAQYADFMGELARGDLGEAWTTRNPVSEDLLNRLPASLELVLVTFIIALVVAIPLGVWAAINKDRLPDHFARVLNLLGVSIPGFWLGIILIFFLFYELRLFPAPVGRLPVGAEEPNEITGLYLVDSLLVLDFGTFLDALWQISLPAFTLAFAIMAPITRMVRNSMIEALDAEYTRSARAFGVPNYYIYFVYAMRNAMLPTLTLTASLFGSVIGGAIVVEHIFAWPGLGEYAAVSALRSDYTAIQGFVILTAVGYVLIFFIVDLLYFAIDPRTRQGVF